MIKFSNLKGFIPHLKGEYSNIARGSHLLSAGFTLVEFLVTVFVFSVMALATIAIFVRAMDIERRSFSAQRIQENALAVLELMAKEIRVGTISGPNSNCSANTLDMTVYDPSPITVIYRLNATSGVVEREYGGVTYLVSSSDVIFNNLIFCILNSGLDDQPARVTVLASISNRVGKVITVNLQTTITSRDIADELQN